MLGEMPAGDDHQPVTRALRVAPARLCVTTPRVGHENKYTAVHISA
jgi:hypothetical protein